MTTQEQLAEIGRNILTQDNLATNIPMFQVQERRRIIGMDSDYCEEYIWLTDDGNEPDKLELAGLEAIHAKTGEDTINGYTRRWYVDVWEVATTCFTRKGCEDYLAVNGHNLHEPRIYVASGYRNAEWELLREHLKQLAAEKA